MTLVIQSENKLNDFQQLLFDLLANNGDTRNLTYGFYSNGECWFELTQDEGKYTLSVSKTGEVTNSSLMYLFN